MCLKNYQSAAIDAIRSASADHVKASTEYLDRQLLKYGSSAAELTKTLLGRPVTINFHPDRLVLIDGQYLTVIECLFRDGEYRCQFETHTSNGGLTAYIGGDRYNWEQRLFHDAYPDTALDRPKYGALNIFGYADGASTRFGSCFIELRPEVASRVTFALGDSSTAPDCVATQDSFANIAAGLLYSYERTQTLLDRVFSCESDAVATLLYSAHTDSSQNRRLGRNLDYCIEAHVHGPIRLARDVRRLCIDDSYRGSAVERDAVRLCQSYGFEFGYIPRRVVGLDRIGAIFRGERIVRLAECAAERYQVDKIDAELLGRISQSCTLKPYEWSEIGDEIELFQAVKQLWHTLAFFG